MKIRPQKGLAVVVTDANAKLKRALATVPEILAAVATCICTWSERIRLQERRVPQPLKKTLTICQGGLRVTRQNSKIQVETKT